MTSIVAFARVSAKESHRAARPDTARIEAAAGGLERCGFEILRKSRFGLTISGRPSLYRDVFGVDVEPGKPFSATVEARWKLLCGLIVALDIATAPETFEA